MVLEERSYDYYNEVSIHSEVAQEALGNDGYVIFTNLYGSQNYGIATEKSDVDTFSIYLPSFSSLVWNGKMKAREVNVKSENESHTVLYDVRQYFNDLFNGRVKAIELFVSRYGYCTKWMDKILGSNIREDFIYCNPEATIKHAAAMGKRFLEEGTLKKVIYADLLLKFLDHYIYDSDIICESHNYYELFLPNEYHTRTIIKAKEENADPIELLRALGYVSKGELYADLDFYFNNARQLASKVCSFETIEERKKFENEIKLNITNVIKEINK